MSEQKMPALPEPDARGPFSGLACIAYTTKAVERIRAEAVEFGRQQERERLEPLRVAVEALNAAMSVGSASGYREGIANVEREVRTLLEQTE